MNSIYDRNKKDQMGPEMQGILNAVLQFGCLSKDQAIEFMPETAYERTQKFTSVVNCLKSTRRIKEIDGFLMALTCDSTNYEMIDTAWIFLELIKKFGESKNSLKEAVENSLTGGAGETMNFVLDRKKIIHITPVYTADDLANVLFVQEKYFANGGSFEIDDSRSMFLFAFRDADVFEKFKNLDLKLPFMIAYLTGNENEKPEIKFLAKQNN